MSSTYTPPEWADTAATQVWLLVLKNGSEIDKIDLSKKSFYRIGRQEDAVDIVAAHPSLSRVHCVFQHSVDGEVYLVDLSGNGTFVNRKRLEKGDFTKVKEGQSIKLGFSSREYVIEREGGDDDGGDGGEGGDGGGQEFLQKWRKKKAARSASRRAKAESAARQEAMGGEGEEGEEIIPSGGAGAGAGAFEARGPPSGLPL